VTRRSLAKALQLGSRRAAATLGRRTSPAKQASSRANGARGGQPPKYRLSRRRLERREGDDWIVLTPPYDRAAREALRRLRAR